MNCFTDCKHFCKHFRYRSDGSICQRVYNSRKSAGLSELIAHEEAKKVVETFMGWDSDCFYKELKEVPAVWGKGCDRVEI